METTENNGLDSLGYAQKLVAAGVPREQAEAHASAMYGVINSNLATKRDIKELDTKIETVRAELKRDIETTKAELKRDIKELDGRIEATKAELKRDIETTKAELKKDMVIIMGTYAFLALGALVTLAKLGLLEIR